uniref:HECT-type E3 ubiquitin transferase n=1 Tax=Globodera pallida TaxID=36090 RepID=A0A183BI21_GLOPA
MLLFFDMFEQERCADIRQRLFQDAFQGSNFQWFYWTVDDHYGGVGEWREFTPLSISQLNKAIREHQTSVRLTVAQRTYIIDFNEMTKRLVPDQQQQGFHPLHSSVPIYAKANLREDFKIEQLIQLQNELRSGTERHRFLVKGILKIIKSSNAQPLDKELACNTLTLLLRLISLDGMAKEFLKDDGVQALLQLKHISDAAQIMTNGTVQPPTLNALATLILRQCIDSDHSVLQSAFEQMINATCNGQPISMQEVTSRRHAMRAKRYQKDWKRVMRMLIPLAVRSPAIYVDAVKKCMVIRQNEIHLKEQEDNGKGDGSAAVPDQNLHVLLDRIITELAHFDALLEMDKKDRLMQPSNHLKLLAEILRSYPSIAVPAFAEQSLGDHQSVLRWIIERFLLSAPVNDLSDNAHWAKAVVTELVSNSSNQRITDYVIGDIKSLLHAASEECANEIGSFTTPGAEKNNTPTKFADKVTVLAKLTMHLRDCLQTNNAQHTTKQSGFIVKSIHKKNLANDFVRSIWRLPLHERQGIDTVNTLLKLFEGMLSKSGASLETMGQRSYFVPSFSHDTRAFQYSYDEDDMGRAVTAMDELNRTANIDPLLIGTSTPLREAQNSHLNEFASVPIQREDTGQADDSMVEPERAQEEILENILDTTQEVNDDGEESEDDSPHDSEEEDMDTGEEMAHQQEQNVHEGAMEDDHVSAADVNEHVLHSHLAADDDLEEMDDDDGEEDEEDETEIEGGAMGDLEDTLFDYVDTDFNALAQQMQDIRRRINLNIDASAIAVHQIQQHMPHNLRALIGYHPRNGGAVVRIRAGPHSNFARNFLDFERLATTTFNGAQIGGLQNGNALNQLFSSLAGWGQGMPREASPEDRFVPCFIDRLAEWCKIVDRQSMFIMGTVISSHLVSTIKVTPDSTAAEDQKEHTDKKEKTPKTGGGELTQAATVQQTAPIDDQQGQQQEEENTTVQMDDQSSASANTTAPTTSLDLVTSQGNTENADVQAVSDANAQQFAPSMPEGVDPAFLAALPEDMRQEVIRDHLLQQQLNHTDNVTTRTDNELPPTERIAAIMGMEIPEGMDPAFLAALPEDIFHEVVRDHQRQQEQARQRRAQLQAQQQEAAQAIRHHHTHHRHFAMPRFLARSIRPTAAHREGASSSTTASFAERSMQMLDRESICTLLLLYLLDQEKFDIARLQKLLKLVCTHPARSFARNFMPKQIRSPIGKSDPPPSTPSHFWNIVRGINSRQIDEARKENSKLMHEMVADTIEKSPLAQLFKLLDSNLAKENRAVTDRIVRIIASLSQAIPSDFHEKMSSESKVWLGSCLQEFTNVLMTSCTDEALREGRALLAEMFRAIPSECQQSLLSVLKEISGRESVPNKLLKSLETLQYLCNQMKKLEEQRKKAELAKKKNESKKKDGAEPQQQQQESSSEPQLVADHTKGTDETSLLRKMIDELAPLWEELSNCLTLLERAEDSQHAVLCLQNAAEAFFLSYSLVISPTAQSAPTARTDHSEAADSSPIAGGIETQLSSSSGAASGDELGRYQKEMFTFAEKHRSVLNQILRGNTQNLEGSAFAILTHFPKLLDFDVKTKYFHKELKKMDERNRYRHEDIAIRVRRSHLFGDSFRELYRLRPNDWKARLYIIFEGEEGQDAGGLLREWYAVITREIFNPNYALFITAPGDRATYMINKTSYVNPEHLDYYRVSSLSPTAQSAPTARTEHSEAADSSPIAGGIETQLSSSSGAASGDELGRYQKEMFTFAGSAFAILTHFPKLLDFDVKTKYFHKELKKMDERNRYRHEDIAIRVRRSHLFGDSFRELYRLRPNDWKARLYIIFEGEEGQDAGGLLREWYAFVGRVIAKAIYDNKQLDCYFTRAFYKHILNKYVRYQDIESEDPDLFKSLEFLLNHAVEDLGTELSFCVEVEEFGVRSTRQLKENGLKTTVTDSNKQEYVHLMCQMKMTGSIRQQLNAFLEGFYEVIPKKLISIFNEQELELLISGLPDIDVDDLCGNTEYKTYTRTSPQIQWFWRALKAFEAEDKAKFLQFVTGTSKVPLQGFAHLEGMNGVQKFTIQKDTRSNNRLPSAHTCFNQLDLPEYPDYETLLKMLLLASREYKSYNDEAANDVESDGTDKKRQRKIHKQNWKANKSTNRTRQITSSASPVRRQNRPLAPESSSLSAVSSEGEEDDNSLPAAFKVTNGAQSSDESSAERSEHEEEVIRRSKQIRNRERWELLKYKMLISSCCTPSNSDQDGIKPSQENGRGEGEKEEEQWNEETEREFVFSLL